MHGTTVKSMNKYVFKKWDEIYTSLTFYETFSLCCNYNMPLYNA